MTVIISSTIDRTPWIELNWLVLNWTPWLFLSVSYWTDSCFATVFSHCVPMHLSDSYTKFQIFVWCMVWYMVQQFQFPPPAKQMSFPKGIQICLNAHMHWYIRLYSIYSMFFFCIWVHCLSVYSWIAKIYMYDCMIYFCLFLFCCSTHISLTFDNKIYPQVVRF